MKLLEISSEIFIRYGLVSILIYMMSSHIMFVPPPSSYSDTEQVIKLQTKDKTIISALYLKNENAPWTILFSHGNAEDMGHLYAYLKKLHSLGFSVLAYDYHGYGTSQGIPTERATYQDINAIYQYAVNELAIPPDRLILFGRSIGTGPTIDLAVRQPHKAVILESAFISAIRVVTQIPLFPIDKYLNASKLKQLDSPILFIHGKQDKVIRFWQGKYLYDNYKGKKQAFWVEDAGHNNILLKARDRYWDTLKSFSLSL